MTPFSKEPVMRVVEGLRTGIRQQRGSTLLVALIMLVLLTLIALSAMKSTTSSIQVVGNAQFREEAKAAAQKAIEGELSKGNLSNFTVNAPAPLNVDVNGDTTTDYVVTFKPAPCMLSSRPVGPNDPGVPATCAGNAGQALCSWAWWDITAVVSDVSTGASVTVHQGMKTIASLKAVLNKGC